MRTPLLTAMFNPLNLATLALAVTFGLCASWWLFPVGLVVWGALIIITYRDPALQLDETIRTRSPLAQRFQKPFDRIQRTQISLFNHLRGAKPRVQQSMQPLQTAANQLTDQVYQLCLRMTSLQNYYMVTRSTRDIEGERFNHKIKIENATDEATRRDHETALGMLDEQAADLRRTANLLDRVESHLLRVNTALEGILAEALRLQTLRPEDIEEQLPVLLKTIQTQSEQLTQFEKDTANSNA